MKFSLTPRRLLALAGFTFAASTSLFAASPATAPLTLDDSKNVPHVFTIASGKMDEAVKTVTNLGGTKDQDFFVDHNYLIISLPDSHLEVTSTVLSPYLDNGPTPTPFTLEIRHGMISENGKDQGPATVGSVVDYVRKKHPDFSILYSGVADVPVGDLYLHMPDFNPNSVCHAIAHSSDVLVFDDGVDSGGVLNLTLRPFESMDRDVEVFNLTLYVNPDGKADSKATHEKFESVVDIILQTLHNLNPNASTNAEPKFQFHEGANLLVVTGSNQALQVAAKVVNALTDRNNQPVKADAPGSFDAPSLTAANVAQAWMLHANAPRSFDAPSVDLPQTAEADKLKAELYDIQKSMEIENSQVKLQAEQQKLLEVQKKLNDLIQQMQSLPHAIQNTTPGAATGGGGSSSSPGANPSPGQPH